MINLNYLSFLTLIFADGVQYTISNNEHKFPICSYFAQFSFFLFKRALKGKAGINAQKKNALELLLQHLTCLGIRIAVPTLLSLNNKGPPRTSEKGFPGHFYMQLILHQFTLLWGSHITQKGYI